MCSGHITAISCPVCVFRAHELSQIPRLSQTTVSLCSVTVSAKLVYANPAWSGFWADADINWLNKFIQNYKKLYKCKQLNLRINELFFFVCFGLKALDCKFICNSTWHKFCSITKRAYMARVLADSTACQSVQYCKKIVGNRKYWDTPRVCRISLPVIACFVTKTIGKHLIASVWSKLP